MINTPVEWMAFILAVVGGVKLLVLLVKPKAWFDHVTKPVITHKMATMVIGLVLTLGSLYYLIQELTLIQIFAAMFFTSMLMLLGLSAYATELKAFVQAIQKKGHVAKRAWLTAIIWVFLIVWVLRDLFA